MDSRNMRSVNHGILYEVKKNMFEILYEKKKKGQNLNGAAIRNK